jgi:hypothetical protein
MNRNIFAHTAPGSSYPEFLSVNEQDGNIEVTVRSPASGDVEGTQATMTLPRDAAKELYRSMLRELIQTDAA